MRSAASSKRSSSSHSIGASSISVFQRVSTRSAWRSTTRHRFDVRHELRKALLILGELVDERGGRVDDDRGGYVGHAQNSEASSATPTASSKRPQRASRPASPSTISGGSRRMTRCWFRVHAAVTPRLSSSGMMVPPYPSLRQFHAHQQPHAADLGDRIRVFAPRRRARRPAIRRRAARALRPDRPRPARRARRAPRRKPAGCRRRSTCAAAAPSRRRAFHTAGRAMDAPIGITPPERPLASVITSGTTPSRSQAKSAPQRPRPVCTSSAIKTAPERSQTSRTAPQIAGRRHVHAAFALNRLDDHGRRIAEPSRRAPRRRRTERERRRPATARTACWNVSRPLTESAPSVLP